jgi:hypothetical protein
VDISFLEEARNTLSYWHSSFHAITRPQSGRELKYFMRLVGIGFDYRKEVARNQTVRKSSRVLSAQALCRGNLRRRSGTRTLFLPLP